MKSLAEVAAWCTSADMAFGDGAEPVGLVFAKHVEVLTAEGDDVTFGFARDTGEILLSLLPIGPIGLPVSPEGPIGTEHVEAFGIEKVAPGLWQLVPSLNIPDVIHAFVVLYGVPDPAPWEQRIIVPGFNAGGPGVG